MTQAPQVTTGVAGHGQAYGSMHVQLSAQAEAWLGAMEAHSRTGRSQGQGTFIST